MPKPNALIMQAAEAEIKRRIARGELLLPCVVEENLNDNLDCQMKMMTIAVNRGLGIGKKRFREKVNPQMEWIDRLFHEEKKKVDQEYALSIIDRLYAEIMEG